MKVCNNKRSIITCDECGFTFPLSKNGIRNYTIISPSGTKLELTYFYCRECKKIYKISLYQKDVYLGLCKEMENVKKQMKKYPAGSENRKVCSSLLVDLKEKMKNHFDKCDSLIENEIRFAKTEDGKFDMRRIVCD